MHRFALLDPPYNEDDCKRNFRRLRRIWESGHSFHRRYPPSYFVDWAEQKAIDVPWLAWARLFGLVIANPVALDHGAQRRVAQSPQGQRERDEQLQEAANRLVRQWRDGGRKVFSKREIAAELAKGDWNDMTADRIERILKKQW